MDNTYRLPLFYNFNKNISFETIIIICSGESPNAFYQGYILPLIDYGSNTWGSTSKLNIERLSKLQKCAARIILKADFDTPSSEMFNELGWSTIENRHKYNKAVLTYKALNDFTR